jgi:flagellar basal body-associated protein FliL
MSATQVQPAGKRNIIGIVIVAIAAFLLAFAYVTVLRGYKSEGANRSFHISDKQSTGDDYIKVDLKVIGVDPIKGDMTVRIAFNPEGDLQKDEFSPAQDMTLYINSATGKQEHKFEKGKRMNPMDVTISLDGQASDYPFDSHEAELTMFMTTPAQAEAKPEPPKETSDEAPSAPKPQAKASIFDTNEPVAMSVDFEGSIPGLKLEAEKDKDSDVGYTGIEMKISRSSTVVFFSTFVMILMLFLASVVVLMMLRFWLGKRKIEVSAMSVYGAMLFAFPAMRNSQPGVPPLGTYSDYVSFFWAEMLVAVALVTIITLWVVRRQA